MSESEAGLDEVIIQIDKIIIVDKISHTQL